VVAGAWGGVPCTSCDSHLHCVHQCPFVRLLRRGVASAGSLRRGDAPAAVRSAALHALPALLRHILLSPHPPRTTPSLHRSTAPHPHSDNAASCRLPTHVIDMLRLPRSLHSRHRPTDLSRAEWHTAIFDCTLPRVRRALHTTVLVQQWRGAHAEVRSCWLAAWDRLPRRDRARAEGWKHLSAVVLMMRGGGRRWSVDAAW
jgi:hypothetical protein